MTPTNDWTAAQDDIASAYTRHTNSLRGALRHALVTRALLTHLPPQPQHIIDIGRGAGHQAIALAHAGHHITILDPDQTMLDHARTAIADNNPDIAQRITLAHGYGEDATTRYGPGAFDAACCHGVLMYLDNPAPILDALTTVVRPGGLISLLAKNQRALAMRPALQQRWADVLTTIDATAETGKLGTTSRAHDPEALSDHLAGGSTIEAWYGVRVFTDHLGDTPPGADFEHILAAEWAAGTRDPYRQLARLFHLIAKRHPRSPQE